MVHVVNGQLKNFLSVTPKPAQEENNVHVHTCITFCVRINLQFQKKKNVINISMCSWYFIFLWTEYIRNIYFQSYFNALLF